MKAAARHTPSMRPRRLDQPGLPADTGRPPFDGLNVVFAEHKVGWSVEIDRPFSGAIVPMAFYRADDRISAVMIEVNRRLPR